MNSKGVKKCFGLLSVLFIMVGLSLNVSSGFVSALKHDYNAVPFLSPQIPNRYVESDGVYYIDFDHTYDQAEVQSFIDTPHFNLYFEGSGYYPALEDLKFHKNTNYLYMNMGLDQGSCVFGDMYALVSGGFAVDSNNSSYHYGGVSATGFMYDSRIKMIGSTIQQKCYYNLPFSTSPQPSFVVSSLGGGGYQDYINGSCSLNDGLECPFAAAKRHIYEGLMSPYWFTYDGFWTHHTSIDSDSGIHYNNSFSFSDMFDHPIKQFSKLQLPLYDYSDYWTDPSNFYSGRSFTFQGAFDFDQPVTLNPNMDPNSYFRVNFYGIDQLIQDVIQPKYNCVFNNISVPDANSLYRLEYTCDIILYDDYIAAFPVLEMYNPNSYIFSSDGDWRWAYQFVITDHNNTPGASFGNLHSGLGEAVNTDEEDADWFQSLVHLFTFGFMNPFAPIFNLFDSGNQCVDIPTFASMIHSNETRVCPWFDSTTRNIVTPVLGFSSMMLLFGFAVRWLGGSTGNFFEDSADETLAHGEAYVAQEDRSRRSWWRVHNGSSRRRINK